MGTSTVSTRIDNETAEKLEELSKATKRSRSFLAAEAIQKYVDEQSWQIDAIAKGILEADKENFATDKEMKEFFTRWKVNAD